MGTVVWQWVVTFKEAVPHPPTGGPQGPPRTPKISDCLETLSSVCVKSGDTCRWVRSTQGHTTDTRSWPLGMFNIVGL